MQKRRLITSFITLMVLLVIAAVIELLLVVLPQEPHSAVADDSSASSAHVVADVAMEVQATMLIPTEDEARAAELVKTGDIVFDGAPLQRDQAEAVIDSAAPYVDSVDHIDQRSVLRSGCEIVSLAVALRAEGHDASPVEIADEYLRLGEDFTVDYVGSPRGNGGGFPACIVDAGNSWLVDHGSRARAVNLTGTTFQGVADLVELGYPVLTWTTENLVNPAKMGTAKDGLQWYTYEHCVVVCAVEDDAVLVADPLAGMVRRDRAAFERIYGTCGNLSVFVLPKGSAH